MGENGAKALAKLFLAFLKIGLFTIGGGFAMIPLLEKIAVEQKKWMNEEEFSECIALSQTAPGVLAINMATYVGNKKMGVKGAIAATLGVVLPSFIIIMIMVHLLSYIVGNKYLAGALIGVKAALCGLIVGTLFRMAKRNLKTLLGWIIACAALITIGFLNVNGVFVIIGAAILGLAYHLIMTSGGRREE